MYQPCVSFKPEHVHSSTMSLFGVLVFMSIAGASSKLINVAENKITTQLGNLNYPNNQDTWVASNAVDGNKDCGSMDYLHYSGTEYNALPWWQVDLGDIYTIPAVIVYGQVVDTNVQLRGFRLYMSITNIGPPVYNNTDYNGGVINVTFKSPMQARFIKLDLPIGIDNNPTRPLVLCEVEVYTVVCDPFSFGESCTSKCGQCEPQLSCNAVTGNCPGKCMEGYKPPMCLEVCSDFEYGYNCEKTCGHCKDATACDKTNGHCDQGCAAGYRGITCDSACTNNTFGENCRFMCGHCENNQQCNTTTGECSRCAFGYAGIHCKEDLNLIHRIKGVVKTNMSTQYLSWNSTLAIDGNYPDPGTQPEDCVCCSGSGNPAPGNDRVWWTLDLGMKYPIKYIQLFGRSDVSNVNQLRGFTMTTDNSATPLDYHTNGTEYMFIANGQDLLTRHIRIEKSGFLTLCEIRIFEGDCHVGMFGTDCSKHCYCSDGKMCNRNNGTCQKPGCKLGWQGRACDKECDNGTFGNCSTKCHCFGTDICNKTSGSCPRNCAAGYKELTCSDECDNGTFGNCSTKCHCFGTDICNKTSGTCPRNCSAGYKELTCSDECDNGTFGNCSVKCYCVDGKPCTKTTGECPGNCAAGYRGLTCSEQCEKGTFGNCSVECHCFENAACDASSGVCPGKCSAGYTGRTCSQACTNNTFGIDCADDCHCNNDTKCEKTSGSCTNGCAPSYSGQYCSIQASKGDPERDDSSPITGIVIGVVVAVIVLAVGVILLLRHKGILFTKKRPTDQQNNFSTLAEHAIIPERETRFQENNKTKYIENDEHVVQPKTEARLKKEITKHKQIENDKEPEQQAEVKHDYYTFGPRMEDIKIHKLWDYIKGKMADNCVSFFEDFEVLKQGLVDKHEVATQHKAKNRYKEMFAYDHSRVPLVANSAGESEYINACFIDGYEKAAKFIASQGPTKEMIDDFWRMVWQQNSDRIVMLTNLVEFGSHKCKQYWPDEGETSFGKITVELLNTETSLDYVIRHLQIQLGNEAPRSVTQYHFKSWPDKDVPDSAWCLVNFWRVIINHPATKDAGPIVVHCSAGVGRTGTFIALDTLYNQADTEGCVRPLQMVETLRRQRVNMVQTKEQFVYLHEAVAEALLFGTHYAWSKQFPDIHKYMTQKDPKTKTMRLKLQFQLIADSLSGVPESSTSASSDAEYSNVQTIVSEIDAYRPKRTNRSSRYIEELDAMYLPNFNKANAFLVAISPSQKTSNEFWSLIDEQSVKTIIVLSETSSATFKTNSNLGTKSHPKFDVNFLEERKRKGFTEKTLTFKESEKDEEELATVKQFTYTAWKDDCIVPGDTHSMLDLLKAVHMWQPHLSDSQPILVHCGDGKKRCGLLCVLINELQRMRMDDGHVNVMESVKTMKQRNRDVIPNVEQFKYCYDVILEQVKQTNVGEVYQNL